MAGLFQRHRSSSRIGSVILLGIIILWAEIVTSQGTSPIYEGYGDNVTTNGTEMFSTLTNATTTATTAAEVTPSHTSPTNAATSKVPTATLKRATTPTSKIVIDGHDGEKSGSSEGNKESAPEKIGSVAVAGLSLAVLGLLLIAVNGYVLFKSRMGSCSSRSGIFNVLQMSAIKKDRVNDADVENDVEDNFKEDADGADNTDSSTSLTTKESPADKALVEQNGEVHVKVDVTDIAGPSTDVDDVGQAKNAVENDDADPAAAAAVVDEGNK